MNEEMLDDISIEKSCKENFGVAIDIAEVIVRTLPTGVTSQVTVFKTKQGHVYAYITSQGGQVLDDVRKIIQRMQCQAEIMLPPRGEAEYFQRIASGKFKAMFPGKPIVSDEDLRYYKNLAPYNPALVKLAKIRGEIHGFERESKTWRKVRDYAYSMIRPT